MEAPKDDIDAVFGTRLPTPPSQEQQAWGAVISIIVIVLMVVIGAFYAWGKRISEQPMPVDYTATTTANTL